MFKHYLTTALRHFRQHKLTTSINACLALGLACFILAWSLVAYFDSYDSYHARAARTFFLTHGAAPTSKIQFPTGSTTPWVLADSLKADIPQLEAVARVLIAGEMPIRVNEQALFGSVVFADPQFTQIFDLPFVAGERAKSLDVPHSAVISADFAERLFGSKEVVGRTLLLANRETVTVTGVIDSIRQPSHLSTGSAQSAVHFDALVSMETHAALLRATEPQTLKLETSEWGYVSFYTYVVLPADGSLTQSDLNARLQFISEQRIPSSSGGRLFSAEPMHAFTEIGINTIVRTDVTGLSSMMMLKLLGALVLLVAVVNYANLATAQAASRGKEVALQRIVGAKLQQIVIQYMFEAALLVAAALLLALTVLALMSLGGQFSLLKGLRLIVGPSLAFWSFVGLLAFGSSILAGAYPAFALSRVKPITALRSVRTNKSSPLAAILVGLQFGSASFLMIAVLVMSAQNGQLRQAIFDAKEDPLLIIANNLKGNTIDRRVLQAELAQTPGVMAVSSIAHMPWVASMNAPSTVSRDRKATLPRSIRMQRQIVGLDFFATLNIPILAGRVFSDASGSYAHQVVIDRTLAKNLGYASPHDALGQTIFRANSFDASIPPDQIAIIGVVEDKVLKPMSFGFSSYVYEFDPQAASIPVVRIAKSNVAGALEGIDATWHRLVPSEPIKRQFADEQFAQSFAFLNILTGTFGVLATLASGIAVMGLIGMALHIIQRRTHEIGVRKTLGASVVQILALLLRSFSKPILIANLIAWPLAYLTMTVYLSIFARSSGLTPLPFIVSLVITLGIAWLAVAVQATRAARMNPATVLRYE